MSNENTTHFQFNLGNIELEITGDRNFVETMYRSIMRDIESSKHAEATQPKLDAAPTAPLPEDGSIENVRENERPVVWVHRCNDMMHKIYMSSPEEIAKAHLFHVFDTNWISVVFADDGLVDKILPTIERGQTLWAELTPEGRRKIAAAAEEP